MRRGSLRARRQLGALLALGGVLIVFVYLPMEIFLIALGIGMTVVGIVLLDI